MAAGLSLSDIVRRYGKVVLMKMGFIALGWIVVYFISYIFRSESLLMLFAPVIGVVAGLIAGWYMAENSVEDSALTGMALWVVIVLASVIPMWGVEGLLSVVLGSGYRMNFGGYMLLTAANLMALASAVWHASSQE